MAAKSQGPCAISAFDSCGHLLVTRVHHSVGAKEPHKGGFLTACNVNPCEFVYVHLHYLVFMAIPTAVPTQGNPHSALIIFNYHLVVVWQCPLYTILHFSFRKADLYPATWLVFFLGFAMPFFHHILHDSTCSIHTCMFLSRLFFTWHLVLNIIKDNSVLPPRAFNLLVPDLLPCHVVSFIRGTKRVCVQCKRRGKIQIPVCLYPVAEVPKKGLSKEKVREKP